MSLVPSAKSPVALRKKSSPGSDHLLKQCENLLKMNFSSYDDCIKLQDKLRLLLIKHITNKDYKFLKTWLEKAQEDYLKIESNNGDLKDIYEVLLKNSFVEKFFECEVTLERLQLKFLKMMSQCKDLKANLSAADSTVTFLKSEYKELNSASGSLEYASRLKTLRLKSLHVIYECERLNTSLNDACDEIVKLSADYDNLMQRYKALSQDTIVAEFLDYANYQDKLQNEPVKNSKKRELSKPSLEQNCEENVASLNRRLNELQQIAEKFSTNIETMRNSIQNTSEPSSSNAIPEYSLAVVSKPNISIFKEEVDVDFSVNGEDEDPLGQIEDPFNISCPNDDSCVEDNTETEKVDVLLDSGMITAVDNSSKQQVAFSGKRKWIPTAFCDACPGRYMSEKSLQNHKRLCHERKKPGVPCPVCGIFYPHISDMQRHYPVHKKKQRNQSLDQEQNQERNQVQDQEKTVSTYAKRGYRSRKSKQ